MPYAILEKHVQNQVFLNISTGKIYIKQYMKSVLNAKRVSFWKEIRNNTESFLPKKRKLFHGTLYGGKKFQILPKGDEKTYKMTTKSGKSVYLQAVAMIDPATG